MKEAGLMKEFNKYVGLGVHRETIAPPTSQP